MIRNPNEVAVLIYRRERYLLLRRLEPKIWHVVAGVVEPGESFPTAAARELVEETGLVQPLVDLALPQRYAIEERYRHLYEPDVTHVLIHNFAVEALGTWEPVLNDEHDIFRWSSFDDSMALLHWPETKEALVALAARRSGASSV